MKLKIIALTLTVIVLVIRMVSCVNNAPTTPTNTKALTQSIPPISSEMALDIALDKAQINKDDIRFAYTPLEYDDGKQMYDINFIYRDIEYDFEVDAQTGDIIEFSTESIYD